MRMDVVPQDTIFVTVLQGCAIFFRTSFVKFVIVVKCCVLFSVKGHVKFITIVKGCVFLIFGHLKSIKIGKLIN